MASIKKSVGSKKNTKNPDGKKISSRNPSKSKHNGSINDNPVGEMSRDQLIQYINKLMNELEKEKEERNYYQNERDKIIEFWEISKNELKDMRSELKIRDEEFDDLEEKHMEEIQVLKSKIKYLIHDKEREIVQNVANSMEKLKNAEEQCQQAEYNFYDFELLFKTKIHEKELAYEDLIMNTKMRHCKEICDNNEKFNQEIEQLEKQYKNRLKKTREDLEFKHKIDIEDLLEKNSEINKSFSDQRYKEFTEQRSHYNEVIQQNLTLINNLKDEIENMRRKENATDLKMMKLSAENKKLEVKLQGCEKKNI